jgi:AcrR family transcriptional regulator
MYAGELAYAAYCDTLCDVPSQRVSRAEARGRILAATGRLLADRRFRELTVEDVMAEAGLARTIFYRHFYGLPDLVLAALDDAVADEPASAADLHGMLERAVTLFARHGRLLAAVEEAAHHDGDVERAYRDAFERSVDATAALAPRPVARALMHLTTSYLTDVLARSPQPDREEALRTLETIWSRVLRTSG